MRDALRIFRKDVRRFWLRILLVATVELLAGWAGSAPTAAWAHGSWVLSLVRWLAQWYLTIAVIQEEPLVGDRQYWLTRPLGWKTLLTAKALFCLAFINALALIADVVTLALRGFSPMAFVPALIAVQVFVLAYVVVPAAALASITTNLVQALWRLLAGFVGLYALLLFVSMHAQIDMGWGYIGWLHGVVASGLVLAGAGAILALQYTRRDLALSRRVLIAGLLLSPLIVWTPGWPVAMKVERGLSRRSVPDSVARIALDLERDARTTPQDRVTHSPWQAASSVDIPVRVTGIPDGMAVVSERARATATTSDGHVWSTGWDSLNRVFRVVGLPLATREEEAILSGGDDGWLYLNLDPSMPALTDGQAVSFRADIVFSLLSSVEITPLEPYGQPTHLRDGGLCWSESKKGIEVVCSWPVQQPAVLFIRHTPPGASTSSDFSLSMALAGTTGPFTDSLDLWQRASTAVIFSGDARAAVVTRRSVAHFERSVDIRAALGRVAP